MKRAETAPGLNRIALAPAAPDSGHRGTLASSPRAQAGFLAAALASLPATAHAQYIPGWLIVSVLSPLLVLFLCVILGLAAGSVRIAALHAGLVILWVVLFTLAAYFVENDYVIWTPLVLYGLHALLVVGLIVFYIARRFLERHVAP